MYICGEKETERDRRGDGEKERGSVSNQSLSSYLDFKQDLHFKDHNSSLVILNEFEILVNLLVRVFSCNI